MQLLSPAQSTVAALIALANATFAYDMDARLFVENSLSCKEYDGITDDLLTAGLGKSGLQRVALNFPPITLPNPTALELRRLAIYNNYRAVVDMTSAGGYGVFYGPNIDLAGNDTLGEGKIAGEECLAYADDGTGPRNVTMMVQIPASFDSDNGCIVAAPSSGSRGVYGAISTTGEWGLKRGCAVAYTDKGAGNGAHDLQRNTVTLIDGIRAHAADAGTASHFTARLTPVELAAFNDASPHRFAYKHAHSERNIEKDWGKHVLQSIRFAFYMLNQRVGDKRRTIDKSHVIVIASSISTGGGASLAAAEGDFGKLIDGVVVSEPQVQPLHTPHLIIKRGEKLIRPHGKGLYDYVTLANLYQPCAALATSSESAPYPNLFVEARGENRCTALRANDLLSSDTLPEQATEAQAILNAAGREPESNVLARSHYSFQIAPAVAVTYANAYGRFRVLDSVCGFSMGGTTGSGGTPGPVPATTVAQIFSTGSGIPPVSGINLINNNSVGGPLFDPASISPSTNLADYNFDGALCLRRLFTTDDADALRVRSGIARVKRLASLQGKAAIIVHGRADNLIPVNHSSRPYYGRNKLVEGKHSNLYYYEVTNAQHFDAFLPLAGYDTRFVPLLVYSIQALNLMYAHLKNGAPLPPSQLVRTIPRGGMPGNAPAITAANVPPIAQTPAGGDLIRFANGTLRIPE